VIVVLIVSSRGWSAPAREAMDFDQHDEMAAEDGHRRGAHQAVRIRVAR